MKFIALLFFSCLLVNCGTKKSTTTYYNENVHEEQAKYIVYDPLPEEDKIYFSKKLEVDKDEIINGKLYKFIKEWEGTKYVYGGETKQGIDCSALMQHLYKEVYDCTLPRTAEQMGLDKRFYLFKMTKNLKEGDLVFFRITDEKIISHVGIYLKNNKFFNANLAGGASISDLKSDYWRKFYVVSGRLKNGKENE
jgi:cell wall-associated NlpC family hydrolase